MRTTIIEAPANPPLDWTTVKQHLRLDELGEQDAPEQTYIMNTLVAAASRTATLTLRRALIQTGFECDCLPHELERRGCSLVLELSYPPVTTIDAVTYGGTPLVEDTDYTVLKLADAVTPTQPGTLLFNRGLFGYGCCGGHWYSPGWGYYGCGCLATQEPLCVTYHAGYGLDPADVPGDIQAWLLLRVAALYQNREETTGRYGSIDKMPFVESLLADRHFRFS
jgi:hypothetical protein